MSSTTQLSESQHTFPLWLSKLGLANMYQFVALAWDRCDPTSTAVAERLGDGLRRSGSSDLIGLFATKGLMVFAAPPRERALRPYLLPQKRGVILGCVFARDDSGHEPLDEFDFSTETVDKIAATKGQHLVDNYWGAYIAFITSADTGHLSVIRECSGWLTCYRARVSNVDIFFSDMHDLTALQLPRFTLNSRYLAAYIYCPSLQIRECAVSEITEVLAGECVTVSQARIQQFPIWNPGRIAVSRSFEDYSRAQTELKRVTQQCINSWASAYSSILLSLSGGLDSAIVLGTLSRAGRRPAISCFNQCTEGTADDERRYARIAAARARVPLLEYTWSDLPLDSRIFAIPKAPKPYPGDVYWWLECGVRDELAKRVAAEAIWTGQGGDHLFWATGQYPIAADYVSTHGIDVGLLRIIDDAARLGRKSYLTVLRTALTLGRSGGAWVPDDTLRAMRGHFVNRDALPENCDDYVMHPWQACVSSLPKTKQVQAHFLAEIVNRHRHLPRAEYAYQRHPLLSAPLMELCLQIPTYVLVRGGRRRGLARTTFNDRVPDQILEREDKGDTTARVRSIIRENEPFLRDVLLSGILVQERIVSRSQLESILLDGQSYRPENYWPLLACISAEIWARTLQATASRVAA